MPETKELTRFLRNLRAVREYTPEPVPDEVLRDILEVGRWSGSAGNSQPTEIIVVRDAANRQLIAENGARPAAGAPVVLVIVTSDDEQRRDLEAFDNGRLVERLLLAARAHGLGANIATLKGDGPEIVSKALGVPAGRKLWTVVTLGHIDHEARRTRQLQSSLGRKPPEAFVHWERY